MSRVPVLDRVAEILATSGRTEAECVIGFTYRALAARAYDVQEPTPAQLSAVRRAVVRLDQAGQIERRAERSRARLSMPWCIDLPAASHERRSKYGETYIAYNPGGTVIWRKPTEEDIAARNAWLSTQGYDHLAAAESALRHA